MSCLEESLAISEGGPVTRGSLFVQILAGEDLLDDDSCNTRHCRTSVVKLGVLLANLFGWFLFPVVDLSKPDSVITIKLGGRPPCKLDKSHHDEDLEKSSRWDFEKSTDSTVDIGELQVRRWREVSIEGPFVVVDKSSEHSHHGDASVLALNSTVTGEFLVISDVSEGIEETKRRGCTNFLLRNLKGGACGRLLKRKTALVAQEISGDELSTESARSPRVESS